MKSKFGIGSNTRRLVAAAMAAAMMVVTFAGTASAAPGDPIVITIDHEIIGGGGEVHYLTTVDVPAYAVGLQCLLVAQADNNSSVHLGNDFIVESGSSQVIIPNVEREQGAVTNGDGPLTLGTTIDVSLFLGDSEVFSGGFIITCSFPEPEPGRIIVVKEVTDGSDTSQSFDFSASYDSDGFSLSDGQQNDSGDLDAGTYSVSESVPAGWSLVSATCDDQSPVDAIDLSAGETVTCTFTNFQDEVAAAIVVTVGSSCVASGDGLQAFVNVTVSVTDGATVVVRDSDGDVVGTFTEDGSIPVEQNATYTWEATPNAGFVFPPGSETSGTMTIAPCNEVLASIVVSVGTSCVDTAGESEAFVDVTISVADGATVVVRDSNGSLVGNFTDDGSAAANSDATYRWEATAHEGFEFPAGFATTGAVTTDTCANVLPFTGVNTELMAGAAVVLIGAGISVLFSQRRREES